MDAIQAAIEAQLANKQTAIEDPIQASISAQTSGAPAVPKEAPKTKGGLKKPKPSKVDPDSISSSVGRAVDNLQANLGGTAEAIGELTGIDSLAEAGGQYRDEQKKEAAEYGLPTISSYKQVDGVGDALDYAGEMITSSLPSLATIIGAGAAAGKVAPGALKVPAAIGGAFTAAFGQNVGDVQNQMKELNPEAKATLGSVGAGAAISLLDVAGAGAIAKPLLKTFGKDLTEKVLISNGVKQSVAKEAVKGAAIGGVGEAATGGIQSLLGNVAAASAAGVDLNKDDALENAINAMLGGGMVGSAAGAVVGGASAAKSNELLPGSAVDTPAFEDGSKTAQSSIGRAFHALGSSATRMLDPWARQSTVAKEFSRMFRPDMTGKTADGPTIFEDSRLMSAQWKEKLDKIKEEAGGQKGFLAAVDEYQNGGTGKVASKIRGLMDEVHTYAKTEGRLDDIGKIDNFLPISASPAIVKARYDEFLQDILPYYKDPAEAQSRLDTWLEKSEQPQQNTVPNVARGVTIDSQGNLEIGEGWRYDKNDPDTMTFKFSQGQIPPENAHLEKNRTFAKVPQNVLTKYSEEASPRTAEAIRGSDARVYNAIGDYLESAAHRIAFTKRFGARGERANAMVAKAVRQAQAGGYRPSKTEVNRMFDLLDAYNGMLNPIKEQGWKTAQSTIAAGLTIKTLPLAALSTLVETMTPAIRGSVWDAMVSAAPAMTEMAKAIARKAVGGDRTRFSEMAAEAGLTWEAATNVAAQRLGVNMYTRTAAKATTGFFIANGLTALTLATRIYAAKTGDRIYMNSLRDLNSGVPLDSGRGQKSAMMLRSMGVDVTPETIKTLWAPSNPTQIAQARQIRVQAMHRFAGQSVLEPTAADVPMWMSDNRAQLLAMLHRYPSAFTNIILPQLARRNSAAWNGGALGAATAGMGSLFIIGMMLSFGFVQDELKQIAKNGEVDWEDTRTPFQRFVDVLNQTLTPGHASWIMDFFSAPRYGTSGFGAISPATGFLEESLKSINGFVENPSEGAIYKFMYKQTPAQFFRPGREAAGELELLD